MPATSDDHPTPLSRTRESAATTATSILRQQSIGLFFIGGPSLSSCYIGTCIVFVYIWLPYMILPVQAALERVPRSLIEASADLGAHPRATLRRVIMPLAVQWWSVWYPGAEPGGGSYIAQRILASKSERDALGGPGGCAGIEHIVVPGVVESIKVITEKASTRIAKFAFDHAVRNGRKKVTAIHKANIMKLGDGLFLESTRRVAREFPQIAYDEKIVDAACMPLVITP